MAYTLTSTTNIDSILTSVKEELSLLNTTAHDFQLRRLIQEAAKEIVSTDNTEQRQEIVDIVEKKAKLGCEFIMFNKQGGWRFTNNGLPTSDWYRPIATGNPFFKNNDNRYIGWDTVQRVGDYLYFDNWGETMPSQLEISALFIKINEDGSPYIPENQTRPLIAYPCYKFIRSKLGMQGYTYNQVQMMDFKLEWVNGKKSVQAISKMPDALTKSVANRLWSSLL